MGTVVCGSGDYNLSQYLGACNQLYSNTNWNVVMNHSWLLAEGNWWGTSNPANFKIYNDGYSTVWSDYYLSSSECPGGGAVAANIGTPTMDAASADIMEAASAFVRGKYTQARDLYKEVLATSTNETVQITAVIGLLDVYREIKDESIISDIQSRVESDGNLGLVSREALIGVFASASRFDEVESLALSISRDYPEEEKNALYYLASLKWFDESQKETSDKYLAELMSKYGSTIDDATLAVLGIGKSASEGPAVGATAASEQTQLDITNFPNPFNPSTTICFSLPQDGRVTLKVYDILGRVVADLLHETLAAGEHQTVFDASRLSSGVYFYKLDFGGKSISKKFVLAK